MRTYKASTARPLSNATSNGPSCEAELNLSVRFVKKDSCSATRSEGGRVAREGRVDGRAMDKSEDERRGKTWLTRRVLRDVMSASEIGGGEDVLLMMERAVQEGQVHVNP